MAGSQSGEDRQKAAEQLKKAGAQVAQSGRQMADPSLPQPDQPAGSEGDPMLPDVDETSRSEDENYMLSDSTTASSGDHGEDQPPSGENGHGESGSGQPDDLMMPDQSTASAGGGLADGELSDEIRAAQEALERAGIALQTAGATLQTATTDQELAEAEAALGRARLAVIIAGQDLLDIRELGDLSVPDDVFGEAEKALNDANVAIVIATDSVLGTRLQLPDFNPASARGDSGSGRQGELDKALNESIIVFEGKILDARGDVLGSTPPPTGSQNIPGVAILGGAPGDASGEGNEPGGSGTFEENRTGTIDTGVPDVIQQGNMPDAGGELARAETGNPPLPEDIPDPQGDDIVAKQLREAAIAETDPELKAKLWEEYKKYRAGL